MKCLIVDDESLARERLKRMLQDLDEWELCGEAADGEETLQQVQRHEPEVVLLDIRMPGMDGIEAARHLCNLNNPPAVIFTTAYSDHALEAFDTQAVDYLLKPIRPERLAQALRKARRLSVQQISALPAESRRRNHVCARSHGKLDLIPVEQILYFQADSKYITVCSADRKILIEESLKALEEEFYSEFIRIHRNALVAKRAIRGLEKDREGRHRVVLDGVGEHLEVSRRLLPEVRSRLKNGV